MQIRVRNFYSNIKNKVAIDITSLHSADIFNDQSHTHIIQANSSDVGSDKQVEPMIGLVSNEIFRRRQSFLDFIELAGGTEQEVPGLPLQTHFGAASR